MSLLARARDHLIFPPIRRAINQEIRQMAKAVDLEVSRRDKAAPKAGKKETIISFNASTRIVGLSLNAAFALLTGWSLRLQGARVINFVCQRGMPRCVLGTNQNDVYQYPPCHKCLPQSATIYDRSQVSKLDFFPGEELAKRLQNTELASLKHLRYDNFPLGDLCLPSMRWILRRHHLEDDEPTRVLYRYFILSAYKVAMQFEWLMIKESPRAVMVFNGMMFPEATARWVARQQGIPVYSHEVGMRPLSAFFTAGDATAYPVDIPDDFQLTPQQDQQLDDYLSKRFKGDFSMAGIQFWPEMRSLDSAWVDKIQAFQQVVPIFTNVIFDTSQPHANVVFPDMFTWLDKVLKVIKTHPETLFVIRAHPDESRPGKASQESVAGWVQEQGVEALPNVVFIAPDEYFSSYEMIQRAKFVMMYNSTIGMEASILGAPVLCAGKARFTQLDTVFFPKSQRDYLETLEKFLAADDVQAPAEHRINARRFLYYQLYRTSLPFDSFIKPDEVSPGFVRLQDFSWQDLLPENSDTMRVISDGLLKAEEFILPARSYF
jgi:hypothetical protein